MWNFQDTPDMGDIRSPFHKEDYGLKSKEDLIAHRKKAIMGNPKFKRIMNIMERECLKYPGIRVVKGLYEDGFWKIFEDLGYECYESLGNLYIFWDSTNENNCYILVNEE